MGSAQRAFVPPVLIRSGITFLSLLCLFGCGGGGGGGNNSTAPITPVASPDFSIAANSGATSVSAGSSGVVTVSATAINGFSSQINVQLSGTLAGVAASPSSFSLTPGSPQQVTVTVAAWAPSANGTVTLTATSGSLSHSASVTMSINGNTTFRTRYVPTNSVTAYSDWPNTHWAIYNPPTSRFFVTDPDGNSVYVFDSNTQSRIATLSVPGAYSLDDTPDHTTLWVGTFIGDVYTVDPATMAVTNRYVASSIGPSGFRAMVVQVLTDGSLALLSEGNAIDGSVQFAVWNPTSNAFQLDPYSQTCPMIAGNIGGFSRTQDRSKIIIGGSELGLVCTINPVTGEAEFGSVNASFPTTKVTISPDGKYLAFPDSGSGDVLLYDVASLTQIASFPVKGDVNSTSGFFFSADSSTIYVPNAQIIYAYSLATHQLIGWLPNMFIPPGTGGPGAGPGSYPYFQAFDATGLVMGPVGGGVGFLDLTTIRTGPVGTQFSNGYLAPASGPIAGGTQTEWFGGDSIGTLAVSFFGGFRAPQLSVNGEKIAATTPSGSPGPVDLYTFTSDGGMQYLPLAFSFGPSIVSVTTDTVTIDGSPEGFLYGYGLGPVQTTSTAIPSDLRVTVNGNPATVTQFTASNSVAGNYGDPATPLESIAFTVPPGRAGSADVNVSTSYGATSASDAITYVPAIRRYPLANASLAQGVFDPHRGLYYFTDTTRIQVFSLSQGAWLTPITIPGVTPQQLWGLSLSPDGEKLAIGDLKANAIYVLNPSNPTSAQAFNISVSGEPAGLAINNAGIIYYTVHVTDASTSGSGFFKLNTNTNSTLNYQIMAPGGPDDVFLRVAIAPDNSRVYFNEDGQLISIDTATDTPTYERTDQSCCYGDYDLTLSNDGTRLEATSYLYDGQLNAQASLSLSSLQFGNATYVFGNKFSADGNLLFSPTTNGIDVYDARLGLLRSRLVLPVGLAGMFDSLVSDGTDNEIVAITGNGDGIAIIDLSWLSEPPVLPYESRSTGRFAGTVVEPKHPNPISSSDNGGSRRGLERTLPHVTRLRTSERH